MSPSVHVFPVCGDGAEARDLLSIRCGAGEAAGEEIVEEGVPELLGGGDQGVGGFDGVVYGVEDVGDGSLLGEGWEGKLERAVTAWLPIP